MSVIKNYNDQLKMNKEEEQKLWEAGFNYPITAISSRFGMSLSYIRHSVFKNINAVVYDQVFAYNKGFLNCLTFIKKQDFADFIKENAVFERKTEMVDAYSYLAPYKDVCNEAYRLYKANLRVSKGVSRPILPHNVLDYINDILTAYGFEKSLNCVKRGDVMWSKIEPFDVFDYSDKIYHFKDVKHKKYSSETLHRNVFLNGDIRIKLGSQISFFVRSTYPKMKMPFLIPYNKTIKVYR